MSLPVLIVTPWYGRRERGGVALAVENLVYALRGRGVGCFVLVTGGNGWFPRLARGEMEEPIVYLPLRHRHGRSKGAKSFFGYWLRFLMAWVVLSFVFIRYRCPVVHFHYCAEEYDELLRIVRAFDRLIVTTFHGSDIFIAADTAPTKHVIRKLITSSTIVTTVSQGLLQELRRKFPDVEARSTTVHNSVHMKFMAEPSDSGASAVGDLDLLFVGALLPIKGPDLLLDAFAGVIEQRPDVSLCIVGTGLLEADLRRRIEKENLEANVRLVGAVPYGDLMAYYTRAKVIVLPSRSEGFSLVAAEAAIMGRPVIATSVGGLPEVVVHEGSGIIIPPNNAVELSKAILMLLENPALSRRLGASARARALQVFDPGLMAAKYEGLYQEAISTRTNGTSEKR